MTGKPHGRGSLDQSDPCAVTGWPVAVRSEGSWKLLSSTVAYLGQVNLKIKETKDIS